MQDHARTGVAEPGGSDAAEPIRQAVRTAQTVRDSVRAPQPIRQPVRSAEAVRDSVCPAQLVRQPVRPAEAIREAVRSTKPVCQAVRSTAARVRPTPGPVRRSLATTDDAPEEEPGCEALLQPRPRGFWGWFRGGLGFGPRGRHVRARLAFRL